MTTQPKISQNKQRKMEAVESLKVKLQKAKTFFLTDYRGLTHKQLETLRKSLKKVEAEYLVTKNRLLKLALDQIEVNVQSFKEARERLVQELNNPTATLLAYGDEIAPIKELFNFIKNAQLPKIKLGFFGGKVLSEDDFKTLASLPTKDVLLATLASRLQSPISGLHYALRWNLQTFVLALNNIKNKK